MHVVQGNECVKFCILNFYTEFPYFFHINIFMQQAKRLRVLVSKI
jgi:hypothetical protein